MSQSVRPQRDQYRIFYDYSSRWHDNDLYGHINNAVYYSYFDSAVNQYLVDEGGLDIHQGDCIGLVVSSGCNYHAALAYPDRLEVGVRVGQLGKSSVRYEVALFAKGEQQAAADGFFTHVFVDREQRRPKPIQGTLREALSRLVDGPAD